MALVIFSFSVVLLDWRWSTSSFSFDHQMGVAGAGGGGEPSKEDARQRFLENEIHKTTLKMTEVIKIK